MTDTMTAQQLALLSPAALEEYLNGDVRHRKGSQPVDYLRHFLKITRPFAYATRDDSWGELEKNLTIVMRRLVVAERDLAAMETKFGPLRKSED